MRLSVYVIILFIDIASIVGALLLGEHPQQYFEEGEFIDWLSCMHLVFVAGIALCSLLILHHQGPKIDSKKRKMFFWAFFCVSFLYLAADDAFRFHERLDYWVHNSLEMKETPLSDRLDDLIVLLYGMILGFSILIFYRNFFENKKMASWFLVAGVLFLIMSCFDLMSNDNYLYQFLTNDRGMDKKIGMVLGILEDTFKILAEAAFVIAFLEGFQSFLVEK